MIEYNGVIFTNVVSQEQVDRYHAQRREREERARTYVPPVKTKEDFERDLAAVLSSSDGFFERNREAIFKALEKLKTYPVDGSWDDND
jgi:hypothetical protein